MVAGGMVIEATPGGQKSGLRAGPNHLPTFCENSIRMALCFSLRYEWFLMIARIAVIAPPMLLVLAALSTAQAAEPTRTLTLACQGTMGKSAVSPDTEREPVSKVVIFNFTAKTITLVEGASTSGFTYPIKINEANELAIKFGVPEESKASEFV